MDKPTKAELDGCELMNRLRGELDRRGIEWRDDSTAVGDGLGYRQVTIRTKWEHGGEDVSVIWGYSDRLGRRTWFTYGAPGRLECWYVPNDREPIPMTVDEILEMCA